MKRIISTLACATLFLTACSKGFQSASSPSTSVNGQSSTGEGTGTGGSGGSTSSAPTWDKVDMNGYPSGGNYAGQLVVFVDKANQSLLLVLPIPAIPGLTVFKDAVQIPELEGAFLTNYTDNNGGSSLAVNIPLKLLIKGAAFMPNERLPNGDKLPFVPAGELPGFGIQFPNMPNYRIHLYIGVNVAAAFVELPDFGLPLGATFPIKNKTKTRVIGAIGYVTPKNNFPGGMYLAAQIPDDVANMIDDLIRW